MKHSLQSHCAGESMVPAGLLREVELAIAAIAIRPGRGTAPKLRDAFLARLVVSGWSSEVAVAQGSDITITSIKSEVGLCLHHA